MHIGTQNAINQNFCSPEGVKTLNCIAEKSIIAINFKLQTLILELELKFETKKITTENHFSVSNYVFFMEKHQWCQSTRQAVYIEGEIRKKFHQNCNCFIP